MNLALFVLPIALSLPAGPSMNTALEQSSCHVFIDDQFIWTLEVVPGPSRENVPVLNIITLGRGSWELRPPQIHIVGSNGQKAQVRRFSIDTGAEPYHTEYLRVLGNSFIGMDLHGDYSQFGEPEKVMVDLGSDRFELVAVDCLEFNNLAEKINRVNFDSPDIYEDYQILRIEFLGKKSSAPAADW